MRGLGPIVQCDNNNGVVKFAKAPLGSSFQFFQYLSKCDDPEDIEFAFNKLPLLTQGDDFWGEQLAIINNMLAYGYSENECVIRARFIFRLVEYK